MEAVVLGAALAVLKRWPALLHITFILPIVQLCCTSNHLLQNAHLRCIAYKCSTSLCECYISIAAAQHSSKAIGCSPCFDAGRNSNRHEKLSFAYFHLVKSWQDGSSSQFCRITALFGCCPWLLPPLTADSCCLQWLLSATDWQIPSLHHSILLPFTGSAVVLHPGCCLSFIGCCSASFTLHTCWLAFCQVTFNVTFTIPSRSSTFRVYQTRYENYIFQLPFFDLRHWKRLKINLIFDMIWLFPSIFAWI